MHRTLLFCSVLTLCPPLLQAQQVGWDIKGEVSANLFFGNTEQVLVATRADIGHADSTFELSGGVRFSYGETTVHETPTATEQSVVSNRAWLVNVSFNWHPFARISPFLSAAVESSLEKRIDARYSGGMGGKVSVLRNERSDVNVSLALLGEQLNVAGAGAPAPPDDALVRWSARLQVEHQISDRVSVRNETFYRPEFAELDQFTFTTRASLAYQFSELLSMTLSFLDDYDSEAEARGARSNNDGQIVFGVLATP